MWKPSLRFKPACPEIAQWTAWDYDRVARGEMAGWVATENSNAGPELAEKVAAGLAGGVAAGVDGEAAAEFAVEVAGFLVARRLSSELEILNFAVESEWRRRGIGAKLLGEALNGRKPSRPRTPFWKCAPQTWARFVSTPATNLKW